MTIVVIQFITKIHRVEKYTTLRFYAQEDFLCDAYEFTFVFLFCRGFASFFFWCLLEFSFKLHFKNILKTFLCVQKKFFVFPFSSMSVTE